MDFSQSASRYRQLRAQFDAGQLSETDFKAQLPDLMVEDEQGQWWMIGSETGQWYVHDGERWIPAEPPPSAFPPAAESSIASAGQPESATAPTDSSQSATPADPNSDLSVRPLHRPALAVALMAVTWAIGAGFWQILDERVGIYGATSALIPAAWFLAGLATGAAIRLIEPAVRWKHIVPAAFVWAACGLLTLPDQFDTAPFVLRFTAAGLVGGLATGFVVKRAMAQARWYLVPIVAFGWALAFFVTFRLDEWAIGQLPNIPSVAIVVFGGAVGGTVGGMVTTWQIRRAQRSTAHLE